MRNTLCSNNVESQILIMEESETEMGKMQPRSHKPSSSKDKAHEESNKDHHWLVSSFMNTLKKIKVCIVYMCVYQKSSQLKNIHINIYVSY